MITVFLRTDTDKEKSGEGVKGAFKIFVKDKKIQGRTSSVRNSPSATDSKALPLPGSIENLPPNP